MFKIYFLLFLLCFSNQYSQVTLSLNKDFDKNIADDICIQNDDWNKLLSRCEFYDTFCNELYKRFKINNVKYDRIDIFKSERPILNIPDYENFKANFKVDGKTNYHYTLCLVSEVKKCVKNFEELSDGSIFDVFDLDKITKDFHYPVDDIRGNIKYEINEIRNFSKNNSYFCGNHIRYNYFRSYCDGKKVQEDNIIIPKRGVENMYIIPKFEYLKTKKIKMYIDDHEYEIEIPVVLYYTDFIDKYSDFLNGTNVSLFYPEESFEVTDLFGNNIDKFTRIDDGFRLKTVKKLVKIFLPGDSCARWVRTVDINGVDQFITNIKCKENVLFKKHKIEKVIDNNKTCPENSDEYFSNCILVTVLDEDIPSEEPIIPTKFTTKPTTTKSTKFTTKSTTPRRSKSTVHSIKNSTTPINTDPIAKTNHRSLTPNNKCCCKC